MTGANPAWIRRDMRLDPSSLPARWSVPTDVGTAWAHDAAIYLDRSGVVVKRRLSGLPLTLSLTLGAYDGVAVRVAPEADGGLVATIELSHRDPSLTLTLGVTRDMEAATLDWQLWSEALKLPMLLIDPDEDAAPVRMLKPLPIGKPCPRRKRSGLAGNRRPRFLVRRKMGAKGPMPVIAEWREIICYE